MTIGVIKGDTGVWIGLGGGSTQTGGRFGGRTCNPNHLEFLLGCT